MVKISHVGYFRQVVWQRVLFIPLTFVPFYQTVSVSVGNWVVAVGYCCGDEVSKKKTGNKPT